MSTTLPKRNSGRRHFIGGSDARIIMGDDEAGACAALAGKAWRGRAGGLYPAISSSSLGRVTEDLNRRWYEANTGQVLTDVQRHFRHPVLPWMAATLDGRVESS